MPHLDAIDVSLEKPATPDGVEIQNSELRI
jgi:hypothetical protein